MMDFNNHYWQVETGIYSSASNTIVSANDPAYVAWLTVWQQVAVVPEADLKVMLLSHSTIPAWMFNATDTFIQPAAGMYTQGQLAAYSADARYRRAGGGLTISSINMVPFLTDPVARNTLANANEYAKVIPHDTDWKFSDGSFKSLTPAQLTTATNAMANFIQSCFTCESTTVASINGSSITTLAEVDAAFAAIPNTVP